MVDRAISRSLRMLVIVIHPIELEPLYRICEKIRGQRRGFFCSVHYDPKTCNILHLPQSEFLTDWPAQFGDNRRNAL